MLRFEVFFFQEGHLPTRMGAQEDDHGDRRSASEGQRHPETQSHQGAAICEFTTLHVSLAPNQIRCF